MSATIIKIATVKRRRQRSRKGKTPRITPFEREAEPFIYAAHQALRIINDIIDEDMQDERSRGRVRLLLADTLVTLQKSLDAYTDAARQDFRETVRDVFGPTVTSGEMDGMRSVLKLILSAIQRD